MDISIDMETGSGLRKLVGKRVTLFCVNYIYTGKLIEVNESHVILTDPAIVFETGPLGTKKWKDAQNLPKDWYVQRNSIESFGELK